MSNGVKIQVISAFYPFNISVTAILQKGLIITSSVVLSFILTILESDKTVWQKLKIM